jgi:hypothetical protein
MRIFIIYKFWVDVNAFLKLCFLDKLFFVLLNPKVLFFQKRKKSIAIESNLFKKVYYTVEDFVDTISPLPFRYLIILWAIFIFGSLVVYLFGPKY